MAFLPMLFGMAGSVVQSGSMQPLVKVGDVVLSRPMPTNEPAPVGRVITFLAPAGSAHHGIMLHRLAGIDTNGRLVTAGDANPEVDSATIARIDIIGQAVLLIPFVGLPAFWLGHHSLVPLGIWLAMTIVALAVIAVSISPRGPPKHTNGEAKPTSAAKARLFAGTVLVSIIAIASLLLFTVIAPPATAAFTAQTASSNNSWVMNPAIIPTKLTFLSSPSNSTGAAVFATQPRVALQGANGEATTSTATVSIVLTNAAGATLTCTSASVAAVAGTATFAGCAIDKVGTYTLTASSGALPTSASASFTISVGAATKLAVTTTPSNTSVSNTFTTQPVVTVRDAGGNTVTSSTASVTIALTTPGGATLTCTTNPKAAVAGVATFAGCRINTAGSYTLTAASGALTAAVSSTFTIYGTSTKLAFVTSPSNSVSSVAFASQPVVMIQDAGGNRTGSSTSITLAITTPNGASIVCTANPKSATSGLVTFAGCAINKAGTYTIRATGNNLTAATSASFTITAGPAVKLLFANSPGSSTAGAAFGTQPVVSITDTFGNIVASALGSVTLSITTPAGASLSCTANPVTAINGASTFAGCAINNPGTYTLTASSSGLTSAVSTSFTIIGPATKLAFTTSPGSSTVGTSFGTQPVVTIQDAAGNTVSSTASVTLTITAPNGGAVLTCTSNPRSATAGVVTFSGCRINLAGTYRLTATSGSLTTTQSSSFTVN
jgi:signal peptidase I